MMRDKRNESTEQSDYKLPGEGVPPIPRNPGTGVSSGETNGRIRATDDYQPMGQRLTLIHVIDALLKTPARVLYETMQGDRTRVAGMLLLVVMISMLGYGFIMGLFSGGHQLWVVPLKVVVGLLLSAAICLPSLYICSCLSGGTQTLSQLSGVLLQSLALSAVLLAGFAPVTWVFSQSTNASAFMGALHLVFWVAAIYFGLNLMGASFNLVNKRHMTTLRVWGVVFILVVFQMTTALRPLAGPFEGFTLQPKMLFVENWSRSVFGHPKKSGENHDHER